MKKLWEEIRTIYKSEGWVGIWIRVLSRTTIYRRLTLVERLLDQPDPSIDAEAPLTLGLLQPDQVDEYCAFRQKEPPAEIRKGLQSGWKCFTARWNGQLVAACWATTQSPQIEYLEMEMPLEPGDVYIFDSFTSPEHRGRNVAGARSSYMIGQCRTAGYKRMIAALLPENKAAFRATIKLGYRSYGIIGRWKIGPWRYNFHKITL